MLLELNLFYDQVLAWLLDCRHVSMQDFYTELVSGFFTKTVIDVCASPVFIMACLEMRVSYLGVVLTDSHLTSIKEHLLAEVIDRMCTEGSSLYNAKCALYYKNKKKSGNGPTPKSKAKAKGKAASKSASKPKVEEPKEEEDDEEHDNEEPEEEDGEAGEEHDDEEPAKKKQKQWQSCLPK